MKGTAKTLERRYISVPRAAVDKVISWRAELSSVDTFFRTQNSASLKCLYVGFRCLPCSKHSY